MNEEPDNTPQLDYSIVQRYWDEGGSDATAMSMMAHEHNLPARSAAYRLQCEINTLSDWMDDLSPAASVLDVGCGAGAWVELFAQNYECVVGVERSTLMVDAARERVAHLPNAHIIEGDVRTDLPPGTFDLIFLGGMCMYLNDADVVALVGELKKRLAKDGMVILREATIRKVV